MMMELERFESLKNNARRLFPRHSSVTALFFKRAKRKYFDGIKPMSVSDKIVYFNKTYYSHEGICWFILEDYKYFSLRSDAGSSLECVYYGTLKINFNP